MRFRGGFFSYRKVTVDYCHGMDDRVGRPSPAQPSSATIDFDGVVRNGEIQGKCVLFALKSIKESENITAVNASLLF